jgi:S1-C subfamily serine protease
VIKDAGTIQIISLDGVDLGFLAIKAEDPKTDLAILTSVLSRPALEFAGAATDGQSVIVIGNPVELEGTVSTGIVSAAERTPLEFQITAPVSPGSSGSLFSRLWTFS